jgi:hypothetical protein
MTASRKRTTVQDQSPQELTVDLERAKVYLSLHFVTAEFDYQTGMDFAIQFRAMVERIAPQLPHRSTTDLINNEK